MQFFSCGRKKRKKTKLGPLILAKKKAENQENNFKVKFFFGRSQDGPRQDQQKTGDTANQKGKAQKKTKRGAALKKLVPKADLAKISPFSFGQF